LADPEPGSHQVIPARGAIANAAMKISEFGEDVRYGVAADDVYLGSYDGHHIHTPAIDFVPDSGFSESKRLLSMYWFYVPTVLYLI
jgi:hypothetical protein